MCQYESHYNVLWLLNERFTFSINTRKCLTYDLDWPWPFSDLWLVFIRCVSKWSTIVVFGCHLPEKKILVKSSTGGVVKAHITCKWKTIFALISHKFASATSALSSILPYVNLKATFTWPSMTLWWPQYDPKMTFQMTSM